MEKKVYESPEIEICETVSFSVQIAASGGIPGTQIDDPPINNPPLCERWE